MAPDDLTERLAELARELRSQPDVHDTTERIVRTAVEWVGNDTHAGITMVQRRGRLDTQAATSELVVRGDALQYELREGPCVEAVWEEEQVFSSDLATEQRWPTWAPRVAEELSVSSMLCSRLFTAEDSLGALNMYSREPGTFDDEETRNLLLAIAPHAAVAMAAAQQIDSLQVAVDRRTTIGTAIGILMERFSLGDTQAVSLLKRLSSHNNRKLYDIAEEVIRTRRLPD
jgi:GAF domain-containing protein